MNRKKLIRMLKTGHLDTLFRPPNHCPSEHGPDLAKHTEKHNAWADITEALNEWSHTQTLADRGAI